MELLRDPIWQFIGAAITVVFGVIAIVEALFRRQARLRSKQLSYWLAYRTTLARSPEATKDALQISFDGSPITDLELLSITLQNSGNVPIAPTDFIEPLRFDFGKGARILKSEVAYMTPQDINASVTSRSSAVTLAPLLLNRLDCLLLLVYVTGFKDIIVTGRIVGVQKVVNQRRIENEDSWDDRVFRTAWLVLPVFALLVLALILRSQFLLGFSAAGIAGYISQRLLLWRSMRA